LNSNDSRVVHHYAQKILRNSTPSPDSPGISPEVMYSQMCPRETSPSPSAHLTVLTDLSELEYRQLSMEEKMDDDAKQTLSKVNLKNKNPFSRVRVTKKDDKGLRALLTILEGLPELDGFLLRQLSKPPHSYQKRWVYVTEEWFFWNGQRVATEFSEDGPTLEERKQFDGFIHLKHVKDVSRTGKSGRKFMFQVRCKSGYKVHWKKVVWKCHDWKEREYWFNGLTQYVAYCKEVRRLYDL